MLSVGIDPGTNKLGLAMVDSKTVNGAAWSSHRGKDQGYIDRFYEIEQAVYRAFTGKADPDIVVIEQQVNMRGKARINETTFWVCVLAARRAGAQNIYMVNPRVLKRYMTGSGAATTERAAEIVQKRWQVDAWIENRNGRKLDEDALMAYACAQLGCDYMRSQATGLSDDRLTLVR